MDAEAMNELKRRAEAAIAVYGCGDWRAIWFQDHSVEVQTPGPGSRLIAYDLDDDIARHIAAANPHALLSLIAHAERQQAAIVEAQRWLAEGMDSGTPLAGIAEALRVLAQVDQS